MKIHQFYTACLAQASYYIDSDGVAAVVDPLRDVDTYLEMANQNNATIRYVLVTHFHADFVSGHIELADRTGAEIVFGPEATPGYPAHIATQNEELPLGSCSIRVLHTPGHTIESACFLLSDEKGNPNAVFTGDTLFVGDVGRPDLLSGNLDANELASRLYDSVKNQLAPLPDHVIVYPGHGAGSACGKDLGSANQTTIGEQRSYNPAFVQTKEAFVSGIVEGQPLAPSYFFKDAMINKQGYEHLDTVLQRSRKPLSVDAFEQEITLGATILDTRKVTYPSHKIICGSLYIGLDGQFAIWAGALVPFDKPLVLVCDPGTEEEVITRLSRIGYDRCVGYLENGMEAWEAKGGAVSMIFSIKEEVVSEHMIDGQPVYFLDVRKPSEFETGHVSGAVHVPLDQLTSKIPLLDKERCYAVYCAGGYRSLIAVSLLLKENFKCVYNIIGGFEAIRSGFSLPVNHEVIQ
ncbi:MAG TPA: rhodanese-like domain-containing protein [Fluviicola sp.]|nr:rhodanese-like domain-containing protein [Fluviicola sp.]